MSDDDGNFTIRGFRDWAQVGQTKTYELINAGQIDALKAGGKTLITKASAKAWRASLPRIAPQAPKPEAA